MLERYRFPHPQFPSRNTFRKRLPLSQSLSQSIFRRCFKEVKKILELEQSRFPPPQSPSQGSSRKRFEEVENRTLARGHSPCPIPVSRHCSTTAFSSSLPVSTLFLAAFQKMDKQDTRARTLSTSSSSIPVPKHFLPAFQGSAFQEVEEQGACARTFLPFSLLFKFGSTRLTDSVSKR